MRTSRRTCLEEGKLQLSGLLADGLGEGGAALSQGLLQEHGAVEVEAVKGEQAHLHLDVRHLHILALARAQHLPAARGDHLNFSHHCALSTTRSTSSCQILSLSKKKAATCRTSGSSMTALLITALLTAS